jgi:hypothetical protein
LVPLAPLFIFANTRLTPPIADIAEINGNGALDPKMDHLACFVSGMFGMGAVSNVLGSAASSEKHMEAAKGIGEVCYRMYSEFPFGVRALIHDPFVVSSMLSFDIFFFLSERICGSCRQSRCGSQTTA